MPSRGMCVDVPPDAGGHLVGCMHRRRYAEAVEADMAAMGIPAAVLKRTAVVEYIDTVCKVRRPEQRADSEWMDNRGHDEVQQV